MYLLIPLLLALLVLIVGPGLWVRAVMKRYSMPRERYPETGGELARKLLDALALGHVRCESTDRGDHYDPIAKAVRLSSQHFEGRSLTALTVAAHEVGHAMQDADGYRPLAWRTRLVTWVQPIERVGAALLMLSPILVIATRRPVIGLVAIVGGVLTLVAGIVIHALTLPTEFDASFGRALPVIRRLLRPEDLPRARRILLAAAMTYVAGALQSLVSIARWWTILRR